MQFFLLLNVFFGSYDYDHNQTYLHKFYFGNNPKTIWVEIWLIKWCTIQ
jgi:hypothetical protein